VPVSAVSSLVLACYQDVALASPGIFDVEQNAAARLHVKGNVIFARQHLIENRPEPY